MGCRLSVSLRAIEELFAPDFSFYGPPVQAEVYFGWDLD
jgi:hypothetical protein